MNHDVVCVGSCVLRETAFDGRDDLLEFSGYYIREGCGSLIGVLFSNLFFI